MTKDATKPVYVIRNIRRGKGERKEIVYANLYKDDELEISATLEYINEQLHKRLE